MQALPKVIAVNDKKCLNCHACISACPVKYCNDGSKEVVSVNNNMCIACGKCIIACTHDARNFVDDFSKFINDIILGEKIIALSAPSIAASFPDQYLNLNGWLKEMGVEAIFDVSFGAELTVKSYMEYINAENPKAVITQPCPAIVSYIELYRPELLKYLAPVDSPVLHTIKMVKEFYPQYKNHKVALLSPCAAKKREFEETGLGDYNIAYISIADFLKVNNADLNDFQKREFDNPPAERAVLFSLPGGLLETAKRWMPGIEEVAVKIEGNPLIYEYFDTLQEMVTQGKSPLLIDCLNCQFGCNAGPLTVTKDKPKDEIEYWVKKRSNELKHKYLQENKNCSNLSKQKIEETLDKYWKKDLYDRTYVNRWENVTLDYPTKDEIESIFRKMHKYTQEDIKNCSSCGYNSCEGMAIAIKNGLNKPENCHYYLAKEEEISTEKLTKSQKKFTTIIYTAIDGFIEVNKDLVLLDANHATRKILKKHDIVGTNLLHYLDKNNQEKFRKNKQSNSYELQFKQSDGGNVYTLVSESPKYDFVTRKVIGSYIMISDITKIKEAEFQLKEANENLEQRVKDRTFELNIAFKEIQQQNEEVQLQNEEILTINESLEYKNTLITEQKKNITDSIRYARRIQKATLVIEKTNLENNLFVLFKPKEVVSGDFYLVKEMFNYSVIIAADCTGHGVPGAFMSLLSVSLLNEIIVRHFQNIKKTHFSPSKILDDLRKKLIKTLHQNNTNVESKDGLDIAVCILDNDTRKLQFAGAFNPLILIHNNKIIEIKGDKMPVGVYHKTKEKQNFTNHSVQLQTNDVFYIFSDGFQDQFGGDKNRKFMIKNLRNLLLEIHKKTTNQQKEILEKRLTEYMGFEEQTDDIVLIGVRI